MSKRTWLVMFGLVACGDDELTPEQLQARIDGECAQRSVAQCKQDEACSVIQGRRVDPDCAGVYEDLGCHAAGTICGDALTFAEDAQRQTWGFVNTCIPVGYVYAAPPPVQVRDGRCGEAQPGGRGCAALDVAACKLDEHCRVVSGLRLDRAHQCLGDSVGRSRSRGLLEPVQPAATAAA